MKLINSVAAATLLASVVYAVPTKRAAITDADVLQYALTLEHLENVFYKGAIGKFPLRDFIAAGFSESYYNNLKFVVHDEEEHVKLLTTALTSAGAKPVAACEYNFPYTDVKSFVTVSSVLEGVGTSAYLGGAGLITNKDYLGVAASILVTEALHTSVQRQAAGEVAAANPYGTGLGLNSVFTLAAEFIVSCPTTNAALPVKAFPGLVVSQGSPSAPGIPLTLTAKGPIPKGAFVVFVNGLDTIAVTPSQVSGSVVTANIPSTVSGQTYVFVTTSKPASSIQDSIVAFGPAIVEVTPPSPTFDLAVQ
ncbi:hypothetical protein MMC07_009909 [Pseudocyphellaria aurata]|nr:hypothetical protein [Pseudocyphellaria aurata]